MQPPELIEILPPVCWHCATDEDVFEGPDPFNSEINDDFTPVWLCDACYRERLDEV